MPRNWNSVLSLACIWALPCSVLAEIPAWKNWAHSGFDCDPMLEAGCANDTAITAPSPCHGTGASGIYPLGDLQPHYPYATFRTDYYDRPYGPGQAVNRLSHPSYPSHGNTHWYSTHVFDELEARFARQVADNPSIRPHLMEPTVDDTRIINPDGYLEYQDWRRHRDARLKWQRDRQAESRLEGRGRE
jgi:hypothetical protein